MLERKYSVVYRMQIHDAISGKTIYTPWQGSGGTHSLEKACAILREKVEWAYRNPVLSYIFTIVEAV